MKFSPSALLRSAATIACAALVLGGLPAFPAQAVPEPGNWGANGSVVTPSAATARWDNKDNPATSQVPRDETQALGHTAGKTYADIPPLIQNRYRTTFGADNGQGGLQMTVSQTTGLVNQAIKVSFSGGPKNAVIGGNQFKYVQVFQCWGAIGADGKPDPQATAPDPSTCQIGANSNPTDFMTQGSRGLFGDPLLKGGDRETAANAPLVGIDGATSPVDVASNKFFNQTTTNEINALPFDGEGKAQTVFEAQTGAEANFMGCGAAKDRPSTPSCWLVAIPKTPDIDQFSYPYAYRSTFAPSVWAQRMQMKLEFRDAPAYCSGSAARTLSAGSELLASAMSSWIPAMCSNIKLATGFSSLSDAQARRQQADNAQPMIFTTEPSAGALHAPATLAGVVISFNIGMLDQTAGYLGPVPQLKLNARLVAKLLTQSYQAGMGLDANSDGGKVFAAKVPWAKDFLPSIITDPEFVKLNPGLSKFINKGSFTGGNIQLEALKSDAADRLWKWIAADPAGSGFLNGCPDESGNVVNPFYSTRSYQGCQAQAGELEAVAKARRQATATPPTYANLPLGYPTDGTSYPLPGWYESIPIIRTGDGPVLDPQGNTQVDPNKLPLTMPDVYPRQDSMQATGKNAFRAITPSNQTWCGKKEACVQPDFPGVGKWTSSTKTPADLASRFSLAVTDTATAAQYQLPTALLCDSSGNACVGADSTSLTKEASRSTAVGPDGVFPPAPGPDYAGGAYPLTLPVYAAVRTEGILPEQAKPFAQLIQFITGTGQIPGTASGQLPPGYAPLTPAMTAQAAAVVKALNEIKAKPAPQAENPAAQPGIVPAPAADSPNDQSPPELLKPDGANAPAAESAAKRTKPADAPEISSASGTTDAMSSIIGQFTLLILLGLGLLAALAAPILRRIGKKTGAGS
ncbi:MAG: hypothetical protein IIZ13_16140 [Renibacterium sp.]|nr:hypothetical protein [Renibacterium sp.]